MRYLLLLLLALPLPALAQAYRAEYAGDADRARITLYADATTTSVNAFEGTLILPDGAILGKLYTGASLVQNWVEPPRIEGRRISFSGIIPGGFTGAVSAGGGLASPAPLFSFEVAGFTGALRLESGAVYLNDGAGTRVELSTHDIPLAAGEGAAVQADDRTPPEFVEAEPAELEAGARALLLSAYDNESGIDRFEVQEGSGPWRRTEAAYVIADESGLKALSVRAYDRAGNFIETKIEGRNVIYFRLALAAAILVTALAVSALLVYLRKRRPS